MKIFSVFSKEKDEVNLPSKWKKFWHKLFNIDIEKKYQFKVVLKLVTEDAEQLKTGDVIIIEGSADSWRIIEKQKNILTIRNSTPTPDFCIGTEITLIARMNAE